MHLLTLDNISILLDAGAYQGFDSEKKNAEKFPFNPKDVNYIFLTHAQLDHVGHLPILGRGVFQSGIISTRATKEIAIRILEDSLKIQQEEGKQPLFSEFYLEQVKELFITVDNESSVWEDNKNKLKIRFIPSEHILGSTSILIGEPVSLLYTGDLGGVMSSLHDIPEPCESCDYLIIESTYGDRSLERTNQDILNKLNKCIQNTIGNKGKLLIRVFSVDRAEEILFLLKKLNTKETVYLDTPMGIDILDLYQSYKYHLFKIANNFKNYDIKDVNKIFHPEKFERVRSNKKSVLLVSSNEPCIILASSGMLEGGRVINHLPYILPHEQNMILFTGF